MFTLYIVRHGEAEGNVQQVLQGQTHGRLTALGRTQARQASQLLADIPVDVFISSDLQRAIETCHLLAEPHPDAEILTTPLLRERDWGNFTGRFIPDVQGIPFPDNVETLPQLQARAQQFLDEVATRHSRQVVVAVSHGIMLKAILAVFYHKQMREVEKMGNAEVRQLLSNKAEKL